MIKLEDTILKKRYNLVDTEKKGDDYYIKQLSKEEAIYLLRSILAITLPTKDAKRSNKE